MPGSEFLQNNMWLILLHVKLCTINASHLSLRYVSIFWIELILHQDWANSDPCQLLFLLLFVCLFYRCDEGGLAWSPTQERGADVDCEAWQCGWLRVVWEKNVFEAESLLHTRQDAHTGGTDAVAQLQVVLRIRDLICLTRLLGLVPDTV